jgi:hypothetical protein
MRVEMTELSLGGKSRMACVVAVAGIGVFPLAAGATRPAFSCLWLPEL